MPYYGMGDYYRGDYYQGDYYTGDPFLGGLIAKVGGGLLGKIGGAIFGKKKAAQSIVRRVAPAAGVATSAWMYSRATRPPPPGQIPVRGMRGAVQRALPGGATGFERRPSRRMNPANPKALRRALRRVSGFAKLAQRAKRDIAKANTAVGNTRGRGRVRDGTVVVNPTAARVRTA